MGATNPYLTNLFYSHYIYLNGKQIFLPKNGSNNVNEKIENITLTTIRNQLGNSIPEDTTFLEKDKEIDREEEGKRNIKDYYTQLGIYLFSKTLNNKDWLEIKKDPFTNLKLLEKKESYNIYEYPQKKEEFNSYYYTIVLFGDINNNEEFIDGFLNYLFEIRKEDNYRLKLEKNKNQKNNFIIEYYINSNKGNFKFITINFKDIQFYHEEIGQLLELLNNENKINLFVFNDLFINLMKSEEQIEFEEKIQKVYFSVKGKEKEIDKSCIFFIEPNEIILELKGFYYEDNLINSQNIKDRKEILGVINPEIMEESRNLFFSSIIFPYSIFMEGNNKIQYCAYTQTIEGYSHFYNCVIKRENKIIDFSNVKSYLTFIKNEIGLLTDENKLLSNKKEKFEKIEKSLNEKQKKNNKDKEEIINNIKKEIENIKKLQKEIEKNNNYLILIKPIKNEKNKNHFYKFSCIINDKDSKNYSYSCLNYEKEESKTSNKFNWFDLGLEYKTIDNLLQDYYSSNIEDSNLKVPTLIQYMEKDINECNKFYDNFLKRVYEIRKRNDRVMDNSVMEYNKKVTTFNNKVKFDNIKDILGNNFQWNEELFIYRTKI